MESMIYCYLVHVFETQLKMESDPDGIHDPTTKPDIGNVN